MRRDIEELGISASCDGFTDISTTTARSIRDIARDGVGNIGIAHYGIVLLSRMSGISVTT